MTKHQIALVQQSFARIAHDRPRVGTRFFQRLFELDPSLEPMFAGADMGTHARKVMAALVVVVGGLTRPETITVPVQRLGADHARFRLTAAQYGVTGRALVLTLAEFLEDTWTAELAVAWNDAFTVVTRLMQAGAARAVEQAA